MNSKSGPTQEALRQVVETFWDAFPPFWHRIRAHIRQIAADQFEISVEQFHILRHIQRGECSVSGLAEAKNISRPAISQAVDVLVHKGLITRTPDAQDRRQIKLGLTVSGTILLDAIFEDTRQWMMQTLLPLSDEELQTLVRAMDSLRKTQPA
jgi:DNA-binding MarR family transcriptional regulator